MARDGYSTYGEYLPYQDDGHDDHSDEDEAKDDVGADDGGGERLPVARHQTQELGEEAGVGLAKGVAINGGRGRG